MSKNRLFNVLVAGVLAIILALTVQNAFATAGVVSRSDSGYGAKTSACDNLPSLYSVHAKYLPDLDGWVSYTEDGPTGVEGGLIYLHSISRACSQ